MYCLDTRTKEKERMSDRSSTENMYKNLSMCVKVLTT